MFGKTRNWLNQQVLIGGNISRDHVTLLWPWQWSLTELHQHQGENNLQTLSNSTVIKSRYLVKMNAGLFTQFMTISLDFLNYLVVCNWSHFPIFFYKSLFKKILTTLNLCNSQSYIVWQPISSTAHQFFMEPGGTTGRQCYRYFAHIFCLRRNAAISGETIPYSLLPHTLLRRIRFKFIDSLLFYIVHQTMHQSRRTQAIHQKK